MQNMPVPASPFAVAAAKASEPRSLIALRGKRNGYLMLATAEEIRYYGELPDSPLLAARAWAAELEKLGSPRVYWIMLSEVTPHLHIHLFPRWTEDTLRGVTLFETRDTAPQPAWTEAVEQALVNWAERFDVTVAG